jgi:hypothetical protein
MAKVGTLTLLSETVFRSYVDLLTKRKDKAKVPNVLMRELQSLHANTALSDLDGDFKKDIAEVGHSLLAYINAMGFNLVPRES